MVVKDETYIFSISIMANHAIIDEIGSILHNTFWHHFITLIFKITWALRTASTMWWKSWRLLMLETTWIVDAGFGNILLHRNSLLNDVIGVVDWESLYIVIDNAWVALKIANNEGSRIGCSCSCKVHTMDVVLQLGSLCWQ